MKVGLFDFVCMLRYFCLFVNMIKQIEPDKKKYKLCEIMKIMAGQNEYIVLTSL